MTRIARIFVLTLLATSGVAHAQSPIDRVEEDWEVVIDVPDLVGAGPQITTTISPVGDNSQSFIAFNLNYRAEPFRAGGLQLLSWSGDQLNSRAESPRTGPLATPGETITWTQRMEIQNGQLSVKIPTGSSTTWGNFGVGGALSVTGPASTADLEGYRPEISAQYSGATWQSNLVTRMRLLRVRFYSGGSLVRTDETERYVIGEP